MGLCVVGVVGKPFQANLSGVGSRSDDDNNLKQKKTQCVGTLSRFFSRFLEHISVHILWTTYDVRFPLLEICVF